MTEHKVCSRCLMDTTVPRITFDANGVCNFCWFHDEMEKAYPNDQRGAAILKAQLDKVRAEGQGKKYDCIVGISGGRDSTYLLWNVVKQWNLRPLAVYFNDGFGNPVAGENMKKATSKLGVEMRTVSADWRESKDLKITLLKASTPDLTLSTDVGLAAALYGTANKEGLGNILVGQSFRTEGVAPLEWNYLDGGYLLNLHKRFGQQPLRPWTPDDPGFHLSWPQMLHYAVKRRIRLLTPFYYTEYIRADVDKVITEELAWTNPGAHYFDDLYQALIAYVLRTKFGIDWRKFNYSAQVRSGQRDRAEALEQIKTPYVIEDPKVISLCIKRLGLTQEQFDEIMKQPPKFFWDYPNLIGMLRLAKPLVWTLAQMNIIPKPTYYKYCSGKI